MDTMVITVWSFDSVILNVAIGGLGAYLLWALILRLFLNR